MQLNIKVEHLAIGVLGLNKDPHSLWHNKLPFEQVAIKDFYEALNAYIDYQELARMERIKKWGFDWKGH